MRFLRILLVLAFLVGGVMIALVMTKPDGKAHYDALKVEALKVMDRKVSRVPILEDYSAQISMGTLNLLDDYLKNFLFVYDHTFYNVGVVEYNGERYMISVGAAGRVWLLVDADNLEKVLKSQDFMKKIGIDKVDQLINDFLPLK